MRHASGSCRVRGRHLDLQFSGEVAGKDTGEHVRLVSDPGPDRHVIHLAMHLEFGEDVLLRPAALMEGNDVAQVRPLVGDDDLEFAAVLNRSGWIGCLCWRLTRFPMRMKRCLAFHDFGFQRVSKWSIPSAGQHHRFSLSTKLLRTGKRSKGTDAVNSASDECSCWMMVSLEKVLSMRVSIFAWERHDRTWLIRWLMKVSAPLESWMFPGRWWTSRTWSVRAMARKRGWQLRTSFLFLLKPTAVPSRGPGR